MTNDNEETRLIVTKRGQYILPISASKSWEDRYPSTKRPKAFKDGRFWLTPDGWVFARLDDDENS
ncbi:hypothetical protein [Methylobacterium tarhaniae]|uniref:hypothetical protein n=1 Tax=Methylobacterium tarhaniae TaxID=1187852 RepID=UPI003D06A7A4